MSRSGSFLSRLRGTGLAAGLIALTAFAVAALVLWAWAVGLPWRLRVDAAEIKPDQGYAYIIATGTQWPLILVADGEGRPDVSTLQVFENGRPLGPAHVSHDAVRQTGQGKFSHWNHAVWFSASDNSDPRANRRDYELRSTVRMDGRGAIVLAGLGLALAALAVAAQALGRRLPRPFAGLRLTAGAAAPDPSARRWGVLLVPFVLAAGAASGQPSANGVMAWAVAGLFAAAGLSGTAALLHLARPVRFQSPWTMMASALLVALTLTLGLIVAEIGVARLARITVPADATRQYTVGPPPRLLSPQAAAILAARPADAVLMPPEWEQREVTVPGARHAFTAHGALHVLDEWSMRRTAPIPPKPAGVTRVLVFGDSLTYGQGVADEFAYPAVLRAELQRDRAVEVYSMGVMGAQSEDILANMRRWVPELKADVVVYGICLNDFLASGMSQYDRIHAYAVPMPEAARSYFLNRTKLAAWLDMAYDGALRRLHLRYDFYDDILADFDGNQRRFGRDVAAMNALVTGLGLPPVVAMALDQSPNSDVRGKQIAAIAESLARKAGMTVIPTEHYYATVDEPMGVSRWEGHPNEKAHALFAELLLPQLQALIPLKASAAPAAPMRR